MVVFIIPLPDAIAVPHGSTWSYVLDEEVSALQGIEMRAEAHLPPLPADLSGRMFASLKFWQLQTDAAMALEMDDAYKVLSAVLPGHRPAGTLSRGTLPPELSTYRTVVEVATLLDGPDPLSEEAVSGAFDRGMDALVRFARAFRLASKQLLPLPSRQALKSPVPFLVRPLDEPFDPETGAGMFLPSAFSHEPPDVGTFNEAVSDRITIYTMRLAKEFPLMAFSEQGIEADIALNRYGNRGAAVLHAHTSVEVLADGLLSMLLWEEGLTPEEAVSAFELPLARRLATHFRPRVEGNWDFKGTGPIGAWGSTLWRLRNRVVHAGYLPSSEEAHSALRVGDSVEEYLKMRLSKKASKYPKTALMVLGTAGLTRLGGLSSEIEAFMQSEFGDELVPWFDELRTWRSTLASLRQ